MKRQEAIKQAIAAILETFDYDTLTMGYVFIEDVAKESNLTDITHTELADAAKELRSNKWDMFPRYPDEFSSRSYLWITPSPNGKETADFGKPVESAYIILLNDRTQVMAMGDALLIFSKQGYAAGYIIAKGVGDFDIKSHTWNELLKSPFQEVILDHVVNAPPNVIKLVR